jgi:NADPH:quinone reductase
MRAAHIVEVGRPPEVTTLTEPVAGDGQTLIAVEAAALNPVELRVASGRMPGASVPYVPGLEGVGSVVESSSFPAGTRVRFENHLPGFGRDGSLRELALADDGDVVELPNAIGSAEAAGVGVIGITAELAYRLAVMEVGARVAVLGATGGVGHLAVQLAAARGASAVVAVGRYQPGLEWLETHGATATVDLSEKNDLPAALQEAAGGPIDVVVDPLWGEPAMGAIEALAEGGRLVTVGNTAGTDVGLPLQAMRKARSAVLGLSSGWAPMPEKLDAFNFVLDQMSSGHVELNYALEPLDAIADAWQRQESFPHVKLVISLD